MKPLKLAVAILCSIAVLSASSPAMADNGSALIDAAARGEAGTVYQLIQGKTNVDARDKDGCTALMQAALGGHSNVVRILLAAGANPSLKDNEGRTCLDYNVTIDSDEIGNLILSAQSGDRPVMPEVPVAEEKASEEKTTIAPTVVPLAERRVAYKKLNIPQMKMTPAEARKYKVNRDAFDKANRYLDSLAKTAKAGCNVRDLNIRLMMFNEAALDAGVSYPPAVEKAKGVFALFREHLRKCSLEGEPFAYYGTKGALELKVWNVDVYGLGASGPDDHFAARFTMKGWMTTPFRGAQTGDFYLVTSDGRQVKGLGRLDLFDREIYKWADEHGGIDEFSAPDVLLPEAEAEFKILFPRTSGLPVKVVYTLGSDYYLEIPIWENVR